MIVLLSGPVPELPTRTEGPEHNARGFFVIGPQAVNPSDVLARMIAERHCTNSSATPENERRQRVRYRGRMAQLRRKYAAHGPAEFLQHLSS